MTTSTAADHAPSPSGRAANAARNHRSIAGDVRHAVAAYVERESSERDAAALHAAERRDAIGLELRRRPRSRDADRGG
jgi:hypothetical protein